MLTTEDVWAELSDRLKRFFVRRVGSEDVAEDLLQETFVRIHRGLDGLEETSRLPAWVFQIARNLLIDHYRAAGRQPPTSVVDTVDEHVLEESDDAANMNEIVIGWLPALVEDLPGRYREAVELYELQGLPQQVIAERLGLSLSGAKSRIQRGRAMLKETLAKCCTFEQDRRGNVIGVRRLGSDTDCCE